MSAALAACRILWPHHTAKIMARRYGRAVVTMKLWLSKGIPEYQVQTVLRDVEQELERQEQDLLSLLAELRRARLAEAARNRSARRARAGEVHTKAGAPAEGRK